MSVRTDLAIEAKRLWDCDPEQKTKLSGVIARKSGHFGIPIDIVRIIDEHGARQLGKPIGTYVTLEVPMISQKQQSYFRNAAEAVARVLHTMMPPGSRFLVVGLGNREITPDALGPFAVSNVIITRHLLKEPGCMLRNMSSVSGIVPGVLGTTGIESIDIVQGAVRTVRPDAVIVVDALASCEPERICTTVQISDTGLIPGSGLGNQRHAFTKKELSVPVFAVGVPTVSDTDDLLRSKSKIKDLILTPRNMDYLVRDFAKLLGYGINLALQPTISYDDIPALLS